jgi:O-methyltransferase involved in polyketide biosynthesis
VHFRTSVLDYRWLAQLPKAEQTLIIAEGLLMYLAEPQIKSLFRALLDWLPRAEILAEAVGTHMLNHQNASVSSTAAQFQWGIDDSSDMVFWHDRLEWWGDISIYDRYPDRWAALYPDLQTPLAELRHKVTKIVHLAIV